MIQAFITSFKLKNTYRVNTIIYSIREFPFIKNILPNTLYRNKGLKIFGNIISILIEIIGTFLGKILFLLSLIASIFIFYNNFNCDYFIHIFTLLSIGGGLLNTYLFNPTKDKYYALILMNMDARKYTLSNYFYSLLKVLIGYLPFMILLSFFMDLPLYIALLLPIYVVMIKMIVVNFSLYDYKKNKKATNENIPTKIVWIGIIILLALSYGLPYISFIINSYIFTFIFIISLILGIYSFIKIYTFKDYKKMYREILTSPSMNAIKKNNTEIVKENVLKQIEYKDNTTSNKKGFAYLQELFVKRHSKILTKSAKKQTIVLLIILAIAIISIELNSELNNSINKILLTYLPYFVFIMYLLNRGTTITQAMFMNCDHSLLTYRFYRTPSVILGMFKERLKTLISINLLPASIIAIGLPLLLFLTGGTDNYFNYIILFISIIAMSIFFSIHYLVMYYLLQPYTVNTEIKSSTYRIVQALTYFICYYMINLRLPTFYFGLLMTLFCIIYSIIALILAYKLAPKTFKLRI